VTRLADTLAAFRVELTAVDHARLAAVLDGAPGPGGEVYELERDRAGPHGRIMHYNLNAQRPEP
jgi:hypothetical protein